MMLALAPLGLAACAPEVPVASDFIPEYKGVAIAALGEDLFEIKVEMTNAQSTDDVSDYADCAAAQFAIKQGYGFARHVRTNVAQEGSIWRGDAVYTLSPTLPRGIKTIDAEVVAANCAEKGIPTV